MGLNLLVTAIILWNTRYLDRAVAVCHSLTQSNRRGTDPYARWWERGGIARCPPIPILGGKPSFGALKTVVGLIEFVAERNGLKLTTFSKSLNVGAWAAAAVPGWRIPQGAAPRRKERQL